MLICYLVIIMFLYVQGLVFGSPHTTVHDLFVFPDFSSDFLPSTCSFFNFVLFLDEIDSLFSFLVNFRNSFH